LKGFGALFVIWKGTGFIVALTVFFEKVVEIETANLLSHRAPWVEATSRDLRFGCAESGAKATPIGSAIEEGYIPVEKTAQAYGLLQRPFPGVGHGSFVTAFLKMTDKDIS